MLPGFGDVDRHPSQLRVEEISPAVIARNLRRVLVSGKGEADFETRRNALGACHGDKERMKVGAVALFGVAGVEHITLSPAAAGLVVTHIVEDVVVNGASLLTRQGSSGSDLPCKLGRNSGSRNQFVGSQVLLDFLLAQSGILKPGAAHPDGEAL